MDNKNKETVEAIIFASGSPISKSDILEKLTDLSTSKLNEIIKDLQKKYSGDSGVLLKEFNGKVQFMSNPAYGEVVADILTPLKEKELSKTLLEVLSTIAYKQPITRVEIDDMRGGTSSEYAITALLKAGLIEAVGRKDSVGHPILYGTTDEFLKKFQIEDLSSLPDYTEVYEQLKIINGPSQSTLFHTRTYSDEDGNITEQEMIAEAVDENNEEIEEEEVPEFLEGEEFEVIE